MSVALYMDEHVHGAITRALQEREVDVITAQEDGRAGAADAVLISRATELGRVLFSFDPDMLREANMRQRRQIAFSGIAYARPTRITIGQAIHDLEILAKTSEPADMMNRVEHLPL